MIKKNINNKGFTLIELLAVIVILAVVMVVTIPSVLTSMNNAKQAQFENAMEGVAQWLTKQNELATIGLETSEEYDSFINAYGDFANSYNNAVSSGKNLLLHETESKNMIMVAGVSNPDDIDLANTYVWLNGNKIEVMGSANENGQFASSGVNIFDMRLFDSIVDSNGNKLATYTDDGYLKVSNSVLWNKYRPLYCGFLVGKDVTCNDGLYGKRVTFKENTQYKITFEGYASSNDPSKLAKPSIGARYTDSNIADSTMIITWTTSDTGTFDTKKNATVKLIYFSYTNTGYTYIKELKVEEVK